MTTRLSRSRVERIIAAVARRNNVLPSAILQGARSRRVTRARRDACQQLRSMGLSQRDTSEALRIDHSVVHYHCHQAAVGPPVVLEEPKPRPMPTERTESPLPAVLQANRVKTLLAIAYKRPCAVCRAVGQCDHREPLVELALMGVKI